LRREGMGRLQIADFRLINRLDPLLNLKSEFLNLQ